MRFSISNGNVIVGLAATLMAIGNGGHAQSNAPAPEIRVTAERYDFRPDTITVKKGNQVKPVITALDHDHGFKLDAFRINQKQPKGQPVTVEFTADQAGTFSFQCSHFCGLGHGKMKGTLVVE
jgi:cytochrome c oxidase subunit 2